MNRALWFFCFSVAASGQQYAISTFAGGAPPPTPAPAAAVSIGDPPRVVVDGAGNFYFGGLHSIFKVTPAGTLTLLAGNGRRGDSGDGGPATAAQLDYPDSIAVDRAGSVYFTDRNANRIRRIDADGNISAVAGGFSAPSGLALDATGNLYVSDTGNNVVRRVAADGTLTTVAGTGSAGFSGDGVPATAAALNGPQGIVCDSAGNLYIADTLNDRVRMVRPGGTISTFAGTGAPGFAGDGGPAAAATVVLPTALAVDSAGSLYIADLGNNRIRKIAGGIVSTIAGSASGPQPVDGAEAVSISLKGPTGVAVDNAGTVYFAEGSVGSGTGLDGGDFKIWKLGADGLLATAAGNGIRSFSGDGGPSAQAQMDTPTGMAFDASGNLYFSDSANHRVRRIATDGTITTVAGNAQAGFFGDGGPAVLAQLNNPMGLAFDSSGNLYIADTGNNRIRELLANGNIGTLAGNGNGALFGDGGNSVAAALNGPQGVAVDASGNVFIADTLNHAIRRVSNAVITTAVGGLIAPVDVKVDSSGALWVADAGDGTVRKPLAATAPVVATLPSPRALALDGVGNVYVADNTSRVVKIAGNGGVSPFAGLGQCCYSGDGAPAAAALVNAPGGVAVDGNGNVFIADSANNAIREASPTALNAYIAAIANAASNLAGPLAPGEIVTLYGAGLGPSNPVAGSVDSSGQLPTRVAGTSVLFDGISAPIWYASANQVSAVVPYSVTGSNVQVQVQVGNLPTPSLALPLAGAAPGLFTANETGSGQASAFNQDGSVNSPSNPAPEGSFVTLLVTGAGELVVTVAPVAPAQQAFPAAGTIGGAQAYVPGLAAAIPGPGPVTGIWQIIVQVPGGLTPGIQPVVLTVGGASSQNRVTIAVK